MEMITIGERIRNRRKELNMSQQELAEITGYSGKTTIAKIESGVNKLRQSKILVFAEALHMTPVELLGIPDSTQVKAYSYEREMETIPALKELNDIIKSNRKNEAFMKRMIDYARMLNECYGGSQDDNRTR